MVIAIFRTIPFGNDFHSLTFALETNSPDEASNLSWSLALLARWEGDDFSIQIIEKKLWPFLQRWSSGEGTNNSAAAVIITIGKFCLPSWNEFTPLTCFFFFFFPIRNAW
jgi:hypothetical protein